MIQLIILKGRVRVFFFNKKNHLKDYWLFEHNVNTWKLSHSKIIFIINFLTWKVQSSDWFFNRVKKINREKVLPLLAVMKVLILKIFGASNMLEEISFSSSKACFCFKYMIPMSRMETRNIYVRYVSLFVIFTTLEKWNPSYLYVSLPL